jgi:hypothetical protein
MQVGWGIRRERLEEADPPVVAPWNENEGLEWVPHSARLSDFLDDMTYLHALHGGAPYQGESVVRVQEPGVMQWLEDRWRKARVGPMCFEAYRNGTEWPTFYIREGQMLFWEERCKRWRGAAGSAEALHEFPQELQMAWGDRTT